jgi:hypothetical protein
MRDLRVTSAKALLRVTSVYPINGFYPPSIGAIGEGLERATEVLYNNIPVTEFVVSASNRLIIRIPDAAINRRIESLNVYAPVSVKDPRAAVSFTVGGPVRYVEGIDRLAQAWLTIFLTTPGSDVWARNSGGGANLIIGRSTDREHSGATADLVIAISRTKNELQQLQAQQPWLPAAEKLLSSGLDSIFFDPKSSTLNAIVSIKNMVGDAAQLGLG